jgi:hypothetical protein
VTTETPLERAWLEFGTRLYGDYRDLPPHHGWVKVKCVIHSESRPSAVVHLEHGKWRCYAGCGRGDVYDLIGVAEGLQDFMEQKRFAESKGWLREEEAPPQPSAMNPNPRSRKPQGKKEKWKPAWV